MASSIQPDPPESSIPSYAGDRRDCPETIVRDTGPGTPPGVDLAHQRVRSASVILPPDQPFEDAAKEALRVRAAEGPATV
jgi:hypothetical protein